MDVFVAEVDAVELQGQDFPEEIVMIPAQVDDLGAVLLGFLEDEAEEPGVLDGPLSPFLEVPAVDDVAIHDEFFAVDVTEEMIHLTDFAIVRGQGGHPR